MLHRSSAVALAARSSLLVSALLLTPACDKGRGSPKRPAPAAAGGPSVPPSPTVAELVDRTGRLDSRSELPWAATCKIHSPCSPLPALKRCAPSIVPIEASSIDEAPPGRIGELLAVRGPITLDRIWKTMARCPPQADVRACCNRRGAEAMVGSSGHAVMLSDVGCGGDESRLCCDVPVFGQSVVAVGTLIRDPMHARGGVYWALKNATLCEEEPGAKRGPGCQASPGR